MSKRKSDVNEGKIARILSEAVYSTCYETDPCVDRHAQQLNHVEEREENEGRTSLIFWII